MKPLLRWIPIVVCAAGLGASPVQSPQAPQSPQSPQGAAQVRTKVDLSTLGPQVGERVPDFSLVDQNGATQTVRSIMGPRGAMLVFVRSADW